MTELIARRGKPGIIVSDHSTEFTSDAIVAWSNDHEVGNNESFNGRMRDELLNESLFFGLEDARTAIDYNTERPHSSLGHASPQPALTLRCLMARRRRLLNLHHMA